jgi:hypothetical protein
VATGVVVGTANDGADVGDRVETGELVGAGITVGVAVAVVQADRRRAAKRKSIFMLGTYEEQHYLIDVRIPAISEFGSRLGVAWGECRQGEGSQCATL